MSTHGAAVFSNRQLGGFDRARRRAPSYQEQPPASEPVEPESPAAPPSVSGTGWSWTWVDAAAPTPLAELPPIIPAPVTVETPSPALTGAVVFLGPGAADGAAASLSERGATVIELATDPTSTQGAEILGAAAALSRSMSTTS